VVEEEHANDMHDLLVAHEGKPRSAQRPGLDDLEQPAFKQGECVQQASEHVAGSEHVSTNSTRYRRIAHQCVRPLDNFLGNSKVPLR
jgi:hypothetical protein